MSEPNPAKFKVDFTPKATQGFTTLRKRTAETEQGEMVLSAMRALYDKLESDPLDLGEPVQRLKAFIGEVRVGFMPPLVVRFAVYEEKRLVIVLEINALSRYNL